MKEKIYLLAVLLSIIFSTRSHAQTFTFSTSTTATDYTVATSSGTFTANTTTGSVPIAPNSSQVFSITVYRPVGAVDNGYVTLVSATSTPNNTNNFHTLISATTSQSATSSQNTRSYPSWNRSGNNDYLTLKGGFSTSAIPSSDTQLYAIFYAENPSGGYRLDAVSSPIAIVPGSTSTSGSGSTAPPPPACTPYATRPASMRAGSTYYFSLGGRKRVLWQASKNGADWEDVFTSETTMDYQPDPVYVNTRYRAIYQRGTWFFWWEDHPDWPTQYFETYIQGTPPVITQSSYVSCGAPLTVSVQSATKAITYNWYSVDPAWDINGLGRGIQGTQSNQVRITPPAGVRPGHYQINISTNGTCGQKSADSYIDIEINYNGIASATDSYFRPQTNDPCSPIFDVISTPVSGATSYQAYLSNYPSSIINGDFEPSTGYIVFRFGVHGPQTGITVTVTALGACGPAAPYTGRTQNLPGSTCNPGGPGGGGGGGGYEEPNVVGAPPSTQEAAVQGSGKTARVASSEEPNTIGTPYPNPAVREVAIRAGGQNARALFYDVRGVLLKEVVLRAKGESTTISLLDLPSGLYHVNVVSDGALVRSTQLVVQH